MTAPVIFSRRCVNKNSHGVVLGANGEVAIPCVILSMYQTLFDDNNALEKAELSIDQPGDTNNTLR